MHKTEQDHHLHHDHQRDHQPDDSWQIRPLSNTEHVRRMLHISRCYLFSDDTGAGDR